VRLPNAIVVPRLRTELHINQEFEMANNHDKDSQKSTSSEKGGSGNFANDPQRASEEGRKGGQQSHQGTSQHSSDHKQSGGTQHGGSGNFADDPQRASEAGKKGGQNSHQGSKKA